MSHFNISRASQRRQTNISGSQRASNNLWLYGVPDAPLPKFPRTIGIDTGGTPLENYWFVVAYGPGIYRTLLAKEIAPEDGQRLYEGFFTFENSNFLSDHRSSASNVS